MATKSLPGLVDTHRHKKDYIQEEQIAAFPIHLKLEEVHSIIEQMKIQIGCPTEFEWFTQRKKLFF